MQGRQSKKSLQEAQVLSCILTFGFHRPLSAGEACILHPFGNLCVSDACKLHPSVNLSVDEACLLHPSVNLSAAEACLEACLLPPSGKLRIAESDDSLHLS